MVDDVAVGALLDGDGGALTGAVWILFLNSDGTVKSHQKISDTQGGFTGNLDDDRFGYALACVGDLDGDQVVDLAASATFDDDGPATNAGAVWILFLNTDGTVKGHQKISNIQGGFTGTLDDDDRFGSALATVDLDGDGVLELAVGSPFDDDGGPDRGAVWLLWLNPDGTVSGHQKISSTEGNLGDPLADALIWGRSAAGLGDLDGDGVPDLAVGTYRGGPVGVQRGAVWVLFLNADGTVRAHQKISDSEGGFTGELEDVDHFATALCACGDLDGDAIADLAVGSVLDDDGGTDRGAVWLLFLQADGAVKSYRKISDTEGSFTGVLDDADSFGCSIASLPDLDGDGAIDLLVGACGDDDGAGAGSNRGAVWGLFLQGVCPWDCGGDGDRGVGVVDLLALLSQWGQAGTPCDFGQGGDGVDVADLLQMLGAWGPCEQ